MIRALLVGINQYEDDELLRQSSANDCLLFQDFLKRKYSADIHIALLPELEASRERVSFELQAVVNNLNRGDVGLFYFSGHGGELAGDGFRREFICLRDFDIHNLNKTSISDEDFRDTLADLKAGARMYLIFDSCFAGGLSSAEKRRSPRKDLPPPRTVLVPSQRSAERLIRARRDDSPYGFSTAASANSNVVYWAACEAGDWAFPSNFDGKYYGVFTYFLLQSLDTQAGTVSPVWDIQSKILIDLVLDRSQQCPQLAGSLPSLVGPFLTQTKRLPTSNDSLAYFARLAGDFAKRTIGSLGPLVLDWWRGSLAGSR